MILKTSDTFYHFYVIIQDVQRKNNPRIMMDLASFAWEGINLGIISLQE